MDTNKQLTLNNHTDSALEKYQAIEQIEKDVKILGELFESLHELVNSQTESIDQIEDMIANTKSNVEVGAQELVKANEYLISNRLFYTGAFVGGVVSGLATYGLGFGISVVSTFGGGIIGGFIGKNLNK